MGCVCKHTNQATLPNNDAHIELRPITNPISEISDQLSAQLFQEILKASGVDMSKEQHYKKCRALHQTSTQSNELSEIQKTILERVPLVFINSKSGHTNQELTIPLPVLPIQV